MALGPKDTGRLVAHALALAHKVIDADTEVSTIDLALLSNLNTNQFLNYIKLDQDLEVLELESEKMAGWGKEMALLAEDLTQIERQVEALAGVTDELAAWSDELLASTPGK